MKDLEISGPVRLELFIKSSVVDTDFTGKLAGVWPNGFAQNFTEGIIRAGDRDSREKPELMNPGQNYKLKIDLLASGNIFRKGNTFRLESVAATSPALTGI
jgi:uncharacterized protein